MQRTVGDGMNGLFLIYCIGMGMLCNLPMEEPTAPTQEEPLAAPEEVQYYDGNWASYALDADGSGEPVCFNGICTQTINESCNDGRCTGEYITWDCRIWNVIYWKDTGEIFGSDEYIVTDENGCQRIEKKKED